MRRKYPVWYSQDDIRLIRQRNNLIMKNRLLSDYINSLNKRLERLKDYDDLLHATYQTTYKEGTSEELVIKQIKEDVLKKVEQKLKVIKTDFGGFGGEYEVKTLNLRNDGYTKGDFKVLLEGFRYY